VSHLKQRKEKNCLNCNAIITERYCGICGQENIEPQESVWHLITHFFNDITHFDGKFFSSLKDVILKPGFLSAEYMRGRRMSYLNPVRFYVFTSFIFFLILFSFFVKKDDINIGGEKKTKNKEKGNNVSPLLKSDTAYYFEDDSTTKNNENAFKITRDTGTAKNINFNIFNSSKYKSKQQYDSLLKLGKVNEKWYKKIMILKGLEIKEKYGDDKQRTLESLKESALHAIPQVLFISLPFFALLLKLLYIRRKKFYYVVHAIFTLHFYIFIYINFLLINFLGYLANFKYMHWLYDVTIILGFAIIFYLYKAMRNFYGQSRMKTIFKIIILFFLLIFLFGFLLILLFGLSIYNM
jgi:hypothetical protein